MELWASEEAKRANEKNKNNKPSLNCRGDEESEKL